MLYNKYSDLDGTSGLLGAFYEKQMLIGCINEKLQELDNDFIGFLYMVVDSFLSSGWSYDYEAQEKFRNNRLKTILFDADLHEEFDYPEIPFALQVFENMRHGMKYVPVSESNVDKVVEFRKPDNDKEE